MNYILKDMHLHKNPQSPCNKRDNALKLINS